MKLLLLAVLLTLLILALMSPTLALAEEPGIPTVEASAGISFVPLVATALSPNESYVNPEGARLGYYLGASMNLSDPVSAEVEASGSFGRFVNDSSRHVYSHQLLGGLRFVERDWSKNIVPYFSVLTGAAYRPYLLSHTGTSWMASLGIGSDFYLSRHVGLNVSAHYDRNFRSIEVEQGRFQIGVSFR